MTRDEQLAVWLDGEPDEPARDELLRHLQADDDFARQAALHLQLRRLLDSQRVSDGNFTRELMMRIEADRLASSEEPHFEKTVLLRLKNRRWWQRAAVWSAGIAAVIAILVLLPRAEPHPKVRILAAEGLPSIDVRSLEQGLPLSVGNGILELALGSNTRLVVEGPAEFAVETRNRVRLLSGRCYAEMDKGASGLRIETPSGEVLDLGTRFGVEVLSQTETAVHVFEGKVEIGNPDHRSLLHEGEGVLWSTSTGLASLPIEDDRFINRLPAGRIPGKSRRWIHWSFDEGHGELTAPEENGFPDVREAARIHGATWIDRDGSAALEFDGIDDWVETSFAGLGGDADRTVAAWVRLAPDFGISDGKAVIGWGSFNERDAFKRPGTVWELGIGDSVKPFDSMGKIKVAVGGPLTIGHTDMRDGRWHHIAAVYLGNDKPKGPGFVLLYVDGELQRRTVGRRRVRIDTEVESARTEPVQFGRQVKLGKRGREFFRGAIDEVFLIDAALTGDGIRTLMNTNSLP